MLEYQCNLQEGITAPCPHIYVTLYDLRAQWSPLNQYINPLTFTGQYCDALLLLPVEKTQETGVIVLRSAARTHSWRVDNDGLTTIGG